MTVTYMFRARNRVSAEPTEPQPFLTAAGRDEAPGFAEAPVAPLLLTEGIHSGSVKSGGLSTDLFPEVAEETLFNETPETRLPDPAPVPATVQTIALPVPYAPGKGRILMVAKARGGIGATSVAVNLALELQRLENARRGPGGGRVALIDLDVQLGNAGSFLDLADRGGMLGLARLEPEPDAQAVRNAMVRHPSGLKVLTAPTVAMPFEALDAERVASLLDALGEEHDFIVIDLPPALITWLEPILHRAERLIMVTDLAVPSIVRARRIISLMTEDTPALPVDIVVSREKKPLLANKTHKEAAAALGHPLTYWLPDEAKLSRLALDRGEPLSLLAPRCAWTRAVSAMAADVVAKTANPDTKTTRKGR